MYDNETVSVIIPVFNSALFIDKTIESVLNQTYKDFEIIFVDDCSSDNSLIELKKYQKLYPDKIRVYELNHNQGAAVARNIALRKAKGRYIAFLDSDDLWVPEKLDKHIEIMKKENIAFSYSSYKIRDRDGEIEKEQIRILKKVFYKNLLRKTIIATPTVVIDRNILGDFYMPNRRTGQDYALWLSLLRNNNFAYGIKESLVIVQKRSYSLSSNKFQSLKDVWEIQTKIENINRINVFFNTILYVINTIKKRIF